MKFDRRIVLIATLVTALGAFALIGRPGATDPVEPAARTAGFHWRTDTRQVYAVEVDSNVEIDGGTGGSFHHTLAGRLQFQVFDTTDAVVELGCRFTDVSQQVDGKDVPAPMLETFFGVHAEPTGRFTKFEFPNTLEGQTKDRLRELVRMFQVIIPDDAGESWKTDEVDANGRFSAVYRARPDGSLRKARVKYESTEARILESSSTARPATDGSWLQTMTIDEKQLVIGEGGQKVCATVHATLVRVADRTAWAGELVGHLQSEATAVQQLQKAVETQKQRRATPADWAALRAIIADLDKAGTLTNQLQALRALIRECPELADMIPGRIAKGDLADFTASALIHALRLAGNERAQLALAVISKNPQQSRQNRIRAIIDLGGVARPTGATAEDLWHLTAQSEQGSDLANTATLALGRVGNSLRRANSDRYPALRDRLVQTLYRAASSTQRTNALTALGNTLDAGVVEHVTSHLSAEAPQERAAAAKALGRIPGTRDRLNQSLQGEKNSYVRAHLAESLFRQGEPTEATLRSVDRAITTEENVRTRLAMARYLGEHLAAFPEGRVTLERLLKTEGSNQIRKYVAGQIYSK